jgi:hypothetical protein
MFIRVALFARKTGDWIAGFMFDSTPRHPIWPSFIERQAIDPTM